MRKKWFLFTLFAAYCAIMLYFLLFRQQISGEVSYWALVKSQTSLVPFRTILRQFFRLFLWDQPWYLEHSVLNLGGNIGLFVPLGFFPPLLWQPMRSRKRVLLISGVGIAAVEVLQVLTLVGRCDIDDLILNLLGVAIGYQLYRRYFSNNSQ